MSAPTTSYHTPHNQPQPISIKTISITGGAATDFQKGSSTRKRRRSRTKNEEGQIHPTTSVTMLPVESSTLLPHNVQPSQQSPSQPSMKRPVSVAPPTPQSTKLVLAPPKKRETRLLLKAPKVSTATSGGATTMPARKNVRKITLGLRSLTLKINKAKRIHKKVEEMKKEDVKALLVEKGLLKKDTKHLPESLMRQMYSDYLLITTKGM